MPMVNYFLDGKPYKGKMHQMPDGSMHTGAKHSKSSKPLSTDKMNKMDKKKK